MPRERGARAFRVDVARRAAEYTRKGPRELDRRAREILGGYIGRLRSEVYGIRRAIETGLAREPEEVERLLARAAEIKPLLVRYERALEAIRRYGLAGYALWRGLQAARSRDWDVRFPELEALPEPARSKLLALAYAAARLFWAPYRNMNAKGVLLCGREWLELAKRMSPTDMVAVYGYAEAREEREWCSRGCRKQVRSRAVWKFLGYHRLKDIDWNKLATLFRSDIGEDPDCLLVKV